MKSLALSLIVLLTLALSFHMVEAKPLYSKWNTNHYELTLIYDDEAILDEPYTVTVDFTALVNMTIQELKVSLWIVYDSSCRLLHEQTIIENTYVNSGWSVGKTFTTTISITPPPEPLLILKIHLKYNVNSKTYTLEYNGGILPVRTESYEELTDRIADLSSELENLKEELETKEEELIKIREELEEVKLNYYILSGNYSELNRAYNDLKQYFENILDEYKELLKKYEDKLAELEKLRGVYEKLCENYRALEEDYSKLGKEYKEIYDLYMDYKSKYEELSKRYGELFDTYKELGSRYSYLSNVTTVLSFLLLISIVITLYMGKERIRIPVKLKEGGEKLKSKSTM